MQSFPNKKSLSTNKTANQIPKVHSKNTTPEKDTPRTTTKTAPAPPHHELLVVLWTLGGGLMSTLVLAAAPMIGFTRTSTAATTNEASTRLLPVSEAPMPSHQTL